MTEAELLKLIAGGESMTVEFKGDRHRALTLVFHLVIKGLPNDMSVSIPFGYKRAFTVNPDEDQLRVLYDLLEWTWGTREITFCDPMAGGGSIPFEALRYGMTVYANELNPVASVILKATLDYPARFGPSLADDIRKYGKLWAERVRERLEPFYPLAEPDEKIFAYIWARTVACPITGKPVPLSPNWWLLKGSEPVAARLVAPKARPHLSYTCGIMSAGEGVTLLAEALHTCRMLSLLRIDNPR